MQSLTGKSIKPEQTLTKNLKDGTLLCKLMSDITGKPINYIENPKNEEEEMVKM